MVWWKLTGSTRWSAQYSAVMGRLVMTGMFAGCWSRVAAVSCRGCLMGVIAGLWKACVVRRGVVLMPSSLRVVMSLVGPAMTVMWGLLMAAIETAGCWAR